MSELKLRGPIERDVKAALLSGKSIDANPHDVGTDSYFAWEQTYLRLSFEGIGKKEEVAA